MTTIKIDNQSAVIATEDHLQCSPFRRYLFARAGDLPTEEQIVAMEAVVDDTATTWNDTHKTLRSLITSFTSVMSEAD